MPGNAKPRRRALSETPRYDYRRSPLYYLLQVVFKVGASDEFYLNMAMEVANLRKKEID